MAAPRFLSLNYSFPGLKYLRILMRDSYDVRFWWSIGELIFRIFQDIIGCSGTPTRWADGAPTRDVIGCQRCGPRPYGPALAAWPSHVVRPLHSVLIVSSLRHNIFLKDWKEIVFRDHNT